MLISDLSSEQLLMLIIPALPNMWALKHAMYHDFPTTQEKYRWMMACVFLPCVAGVAYYFVGRKHASREKVDIRARIEAERARAAEEKAKAAEAAGEAVPTAADAVHDAERQDVLSAGQSPQAGQEPDRAPEHGTRQTGGASSDNAAFPREEGERPGARKNAPGDEWSFGCPDDVRKPQA